MFASTVAAVSGSISINFARYVASRNAIHFCLK